MAAIRPSIFKSERPGRPVRWAVEWQEEGRQRRRLFRTRREALDHRRKVEDVSGDPKSDRLDQFAPAWLEGCRRGGLRAGTLTVLAWAVNNHIIPAFGDRSLGSITTAEVRAFIDGKVADSLAHKTVGNIRQAFHSMMEQAAQDGHIRANPAKGIRLRGRRAHDEVKALDADQLRAFLATAVEASPEHALLFRLLALTGLRIGEALALRRDDVEGDRLHIRRGLTPQGNIEPTKTGEMRKVELVASLAAALKEADPWPWVGKSHAWAGGGMRRVLKVAKLPEHFTPHCLRHSFASLHLAANVNPIWVQRQLGHRQLSMTVDLYGRWIPLDSQGAPEALAERLLGAA